MAVQVGDKAPNFALPNQDNRLVSLDSFEGFRLVMFAFPKAGTPQCNRQACAYRDAYADFKRMARGGMTY